MQTVPETPASRKPTAFYAQFHGLSGVLTKRGDHVLFLDTESTAVVTITTADAPHLVVLGEVAEAMTQYVTDMTAGGYAAVACGREEGVR
jgi:hypothetical protein